MRAIGPAFVILAVLPHVEDPWPDMIGFGFPFAIAGAFGMLANVLYAARPAAERDEAVRIGGALGFWLGLLFYSLALFNQVALGW